MTKLKVSEARALICACQGLTNRSESPLHSIHKVWGVQTQYCQSLPIGVAARTKNLGFSFPQLNLAPGGNLVKSWAIRYTLHTMAKGDFALWRDGFGNRACEMFEDWMVRKRSIPLAELNRRHEVMLDALKMGPMTRKQLHDVVPEFKTLDSTGWGADVMGLAVAGKISIVSHLGPTTFALLELEQSGFSEPEARIELLRRYFLSYGIGSKADFRRWSGVSDAVARVCWQGMQDDLAPVDVEGFSGLFALNQTVERLSDIPASPRARLLSKFDTFVLGHKDKRLYLPDRFRERVFRKAGQVEAVVLANGAVCGTWRHKVTGKRLMISLELWPECAPKDIVRRIEREASHLIKCLGIADFHLELGKVSI